MNFKEEKDLFLYCLLARFISAFRELFLGTDIIVKSLGAMDFLKEYRG